MTLDSTGESMQAMFIFETRQLVEDLEQRILDSEKVGGFGGSVHDIFRIMHTIKGNSAMMMIDNIASLAHHLEDLFYYLRENNTPEIDYVSLSDILLKAIDFIKNELISIENNEGVKGDTSELSGLIYAYLDYLKSMPGGSREVNNNPQLEAISKSECSWSTKTASEPQPFKRFQVLVLFAEDCGMENVRAFLLLHKLEEMAEQIEYFPTNIVENEASSQLIRTNGFRMVFASSFSQEEIAAHLQAAAFISRLEIEEIVPPSALPVSGQASMEQDQTVTELAAWQPLNPDKDDHHKPIRPAALINVNVGKLDTLMDLVGELVIAEAMVTQNPELLGLQLDGFFKASRQLSKITHDLQDIVMSIRMVPMAMTFQKMQRVVRDMSHSLNKQVELDLIGEETEVDKNIIEQIADPLIHLIRNAVDHGIETAQERKHLGKNEQGKISLEARNSGGDVWIIIRDDGRGLDKDKILTKAHEHGLLDKNQIEPSEREIYSYILLPGFSTKIEVDEFSGRGVGMDVVNKNIEKIGGTVLIDSSPGKGTVISLKIPLTLAIIDGMVVKVGNASFTVAMTSIRESFSIHDEDLICDPAGNEMLLIRGEAYTVFRLHERFRLHSDITRLQDGIIIMVEYEGRCVCLLADRLLGEQQVVIKPLPEFVQRIRGKVRGISGCTLLGDGTISLILDVAGLINNC